MLVGTWVYKCHVKSLHSVLWGYLPKKLSSTFKAPFLHRVPGGGAACWFLNQPFVEAAAHSWATAGVVAAIF